MIDAMKMEVLILALIEINNLTKDYGGGRGIFDIDLSVEKVEV